MAPKVILHSVSKPITKIWFIHVPIFSTLKHVNMHAIFKTWNNLFIQVSYQQG